MGASWESVLKIKHLTKCEKVKARESKTIVSDKNTLRLVNIHKSWIFEIKVHVLKLMKNEPPIYHWKGLKT